MNLHRFCTFIFIFALFVACTTPIAHALTFTPMAGIPGLTSGGGTYTLSGFINKLYIFLITAGAVIGVVKIAFAGVKYATSDIGGNKSAAKEDIKGVLLGLAILTLPYLVLSAINPGFTNLNVLKLLTPLGLEDGSLFGGSFTTPPSSSDESDKSDGYATTGKTCGDCISTKTNPSMCHDYVLGCTDSKGLYSNTKLNPEQTAHHCIVPSQTIPCPAGSSDPTTSYTAKCASTCDSASSGDDCHAFLYICEQMPGLPKDENSNHIYVCWTAPENAKKCPITDKEGGGINNPNDEKNCIFKDTKNTPKTELEKTCTENAGSLTGPTHVDGSLFGLGEYDEYICRVGANTACPAPFTN